MKSMVPCHKKNGGHSFFCVFCLLGVLISALCLGSIRVYGLYLEYRLADCVRRTESEGEIYAMLEETHAALLSPSRIYNYARSELNMVAAGTAETIKLPSDSRGPEGGDNATRGENAVHRQGWLSRIFMGAANAKE
jgi:hypothetical protein